MTKTDLAAVFNKSGFQPWKMIKMENHFRKWQSGPTSVTWSCKHSCWRSHCCYSVSYLWYYCSVSDLISEVSVLQWWASATNIQDHWTHFFCWLWRILEKLYCSANIWPWNTSSAPADLRSDLYTDYVWIHLLFITAASLQPRE